MEFCNISHYVPEQDYMRFLMFFEYDLHINSKFKKELESRTDFKKNRRDK